MIQRCWTIEAFSFSRSQAQSKPCSVGDTPDPTGKPSSGVARCFSGGDEHLLFTQTVAENVLDPRIVSMAIRTSIASWTKKMPRPAPLHFHH